MLSSFTNVNRAIDACTRCPRLRAYCERVARDDGLELTDCYISAVARCAPPGNKPTLAELERCRPYLEAELRLLQRLRVVVTLGRVAHDGWLKAAGWWTRLAPRERPAFAH